MTLFRPIRGRREDQIARRCQPNRSPTRSNETQSFAVLRSKCAAVALWRNRDRDLGPRALQPATPRPNSRRRHALDIRGTAQGPFTRQAPDVEAAAVAKTSDEAYARGRFPNGRKEAE